MPLIVLLVLGGCSKEEGNNNPVVPAPTPTTGTIAGKITLPPGAGGSIENIRVTIYQNVVDWNWDRAITTSATDASGNYALNNLTPGTYYLDAWKDNYNNQVIDAGDYYGVYGSGTYPYYQLNPCQCSAGNTTTLNFIIYPL
ncbi:MAG: hypothetical protein Kow0098_08070 [Ignavibacteriaceae bacterium]